MDNITPCLVDTESYTELHDRIVWYDGDMSCAPDSVMHFLENVPVSALHTTKVTPEIKQYNSLVQTDNKITVKSQFKPLDFEWQLPILFKTLDVEQFVLDQLDCFNFSPKQKVIRYQRVIEELDLFVKFGYLDMIRCLIYIVSVLENTNQVWGIGRGSSVSSYVLYLIGVHEIDSVQYNLPFSDFLRHTN